MALIIKDRVKEITTTTGTGAVSLGGASATFDAFSSVMSNGDTTFYAIVHTTSGTDEWEVGVGTWNTGNTLTRTTVYAGSNGTSAVNLSSGNKDIFMTYPASKAAVAGEDVTFADVTATDITATGTVTLAGDPTSALQAATKEYVDTIAAAGIHYHTPVRVESPSNLNATYDNGSSGVGATLTNAGTQAALVIDGVTLNSADRVLVYNQTNAAHNGVYTVTNTGSASTNWVLTRATDADSYGASDPDAMGEGDAYFVKEGDTGAGELYVMNTAGTITFGTTDITFTVIAETAVYSAGDSLTLTGTTFDTVQDIRTTASPTFNNITVTGTVDGRDLATDGSKLDGIESGATADQTAAEIKTAYESNSDTNAFTDAEKTKLSGIETGATGDQSASEILTAIKTVDGAASGLDADLLDGQQGSYYLNTSTSFGGDVSGTYNNIVVADDSHNHVTSNIDGLAEYISDTVGAMVGGNTESGISVTYDDADNTLDFNVNDPTITLTGDVTGSATMTNLGNVSITATVADDSHNHVTSNIDGFTEAVQDIVGGMVSGNTESGISVTYDDAGNSLDFNVNDPTITLTGDVSGSATMTNLGNVSITATVADDSHNHVIPNVDGLQSALDAKLASSSYTASDVLTKIKTVDGSGSGLDADTLDGYHLSTTRNSANTVPVRDSNGYLQVGWINSTSGATTSTINKIYASYDDYMRYVTPATFRSQVTDGTYVNVTGDTMTGALRHDQESNTASGGTLTLNLANSNNFKVTLTANTTIAFSNVDAGRFGNIIFVQDTTGGRSFTLPSSCKTPVGGASIVQATNANEISVLSYYVLDGSTILVNYIGDFA